MYPTYTSTSRGSIHAPFVPTPVRKFAAALFGRVRSSVSLLLLAAVALLPTALHADVHGGSWGAKATLSGASYTQIYGLANVTANTNYTASIWIKGSGTLTFVVNNPAWTYQPASMTVTATSTWTQVTLPTFNSGSNTQMVLRLYDNIGSASGSVMWIDDGFLGTGSTNLVGNPGFESGTSNWVIGTAFAVGQFGSSGPPLANGTYTLAPSNATGLRLDVQGAGTGNGTNVIAATSNGGTNQQWILTNVSGNVYRLSPAHATAQCLDVSGQATTSGTNVQIWQYLNQQNQNWAITATTGGYTLTPQHATGLRLNSPTTANGSDVNVTTADGSGGQTWVINAVTGSAPAAPTGLGATGGNAQVGLSWTASSGATSYSVYRGTTSNGQSGTPIATSITGTSFSDTAVTNGTTYYYKVRAVNSSGTSGDSNEASATPAGTLANGTYTLAPANATGLRLDVQSSGTTNGTNVLAVTSNGGTNQQWIVTNVSGNVYRLSPAHASAQCLDVSGQSTASGTNVQIWQYLNQQNQNWAITAVSGGYTLTPQHATGLRLNSPTTSSGSDVNVTTANGSTAQTWVFAAVTGSAPSAPSGLSASGGMSQVNLSWTASGGATSYNVYRGTTSNGQSGTPITTGVTGTSYTDSAVTNGTTYYYKVRAVNSFGTSGDSNEASATPSAGGGETIGGGSIGSPANGPAASFGLGGGFTLVKNWNFGTSGTIKNKADLDQNFMYHDQFGTIANGSNYGALMVASDSANAINDGTHGAQPYVGKVINGVAVPEVRTFSTDALKMLLVPLGGASTVAPTSYNTGCGSFTAQWSLPNGGSLLNQDVLWETRVRMVTPPYFWFAIWNAGTQWNGGAEMDVVESFGYDNGGGNTNYDGRYWHSNSVGGNDTLVPNFINNWSAGMAQSGITSFDATQWHTWTWIYRKNNTYDVYVDGIRCQSGTINWTNGGGAGGTPINLFFLFDGGWGHTQVGSVNHSMPASNFSGKYYEWDYSRVYLRN